MVYPFRGRVATNTQASIHAASIISTSISILHLSHHAYPSDSGTTLLT